MLKLKQSSERSEQGKTYWGCRACHAWCSYLAFDTARPVTSTGSARQALGVTGQRRVIRNSQISQVASLARLTWQCCPTSQPVHDHEEHAYVPGHHPWWRCPAAALQLVPTLKKLREKHVFQERGCHAPVAKVRRSESQFLLPSTTWVPRTSFGLQGTSCSKQSSLPITSTHERAWTVWHT